MLDLWFEQDVKPRLRQRAFLIRSADDFVLGFRDQRDAQRVLEVLPKRFGTYGLSIHPTKTKLVPCCPPSAMTKGQSGSGSGRPGTFNLLGFTHSWGRSLRGDGVIKRQTAADRFGRAVRSIDSWCRANRPIALREQQPKLNDKLRGHDAYYGVTGNSGALSRFLWEAPRRWR